MDQYGEPAKLDVVAQIHGKFFLSEIATHTGENTIMQPELTCYRRNLFQISGSIICPAGPLSVDTGYGESMSIVSHEITVSATESVEGHNIRLVVIPWKTPPANSPDLPEQEPVAIPIDILGNEDKNNETISQQIAWSRLQFRVATANNGRRKEIQQHFILRLKLISTLADGSRVCTVESATAPMVVRGRSPRNFQARKEIPLVGSSALPRGHNSRVSPSQKKDSLIPKRPGIAKPATMGLLKRPFHYPQWNQAQQQSRHAAPPTTPFSQPWSSIAAYSNEIQRLHTVQDPPPLHRLPEQILPIESSSQHLYSPTASLSAQFDPNQRPMISPRYTEVPHNPLYQPFEYAPAPAPWSITKTDGPTYGAALHLPPQQPPYQTEQVHARDDTQNIAYTWSAAG
ncbi:hypothetical protein VE01_09464 [Pseudogymnoascus verrucosus]|uniref:NDT80 domain-containing protein n=1 Tax=Pseudogymnoascus verrucosus TaxID=342668 RepID=A0A1B8G9P1_9PEZI|nr:uncharacterized protein VE01_09464 [Pseudogymnoascus verrucosus]OBT92543.2 hypothetical protein VE01_09464 [Pseudogymnoascus verrucosus]